MKKTIRIGGDGDVRRIEVIVRGPALPQIECPFCFDDSPLARPNAFAAGYYAAILSLDEGKLTLGRLMCAEHAHDVGLALYGIGGNVAELREGMAPGCSGGGPNGCH